ncbi:hypothetical protein CDAR_691 [Caerostris darwini]|uniref:Uncharacterized protein n=1 Tax=Caerostris darwini TaxID=1538125 RepID=A0AAV4UCH3_9ARAC|nr:hypothetical protein CDAR_691 [Caerostris darwini]
MSSRLQGFYIDGVSRTPPHITPPRYTGALGSLSSGGWFAKRSGLSQGLATFEIRRLENRLVKLLIREILSKLLFALKNYNLYDEVDL